MKAYAIHVYRITEKTEMSKELAEKLVSVYSDIPEETNTLFKGGSHQFAVSEDGRFGVDIVTVDIGSRDGFSSDLAVMVPRCPGNRDEVLTFASTFTWSVLSVINPSRYAELLKKTEDRTPEGKAALEEYIKFITIGEPLDDQLGNCDTFYVLRGQGPAFSDYLLRGVLRSATFSNAAPDRVLH